MNIKTAAILLSGVAALALRAGADETHLPDNEALRHIRAISAPRLSPDGRRVLISLSETTADGAANHLWLIDVAANTARQITFSPSGEKRGETSGRWTADGTNVLFLAKRGDHTQLFSLPMAGGEAKPFDLKVMPQADLSAEDDAVPPRKDGKPADKTEALPIDIDSFSVSPAGTIALLVKDPETPGEKKQKEEKADANHVDHDPHGVRLYLLDPASGNLTPAAVPPNVEKAVWNRAGDQLIAITEAPNGQSDLAPAKSAWTLSVKDPGHPARLISAPPTITDGDWSDDGKRFYLLAQAGQDAPPGVHDLYALSLADGSLQNLTTGVAGTPANMAPIAVPGGVVQTMQIGTRQVLMRFGDKKPETIASDLPVVRDASNNGKGWIWVAAGPAQPDQVWISEKLGHAAKPLSLPDLVPEPWSKVPSHLVQWQNEGQTIEGLLTLPPQAGPGKIPLILMVHGGPAGVWQDKFDALLYHFLAQGWAVLRPNPRGSTGYGASFAAANKNDLGGADFRDLMAGVDKMITDYPIDADRLAYYGYSYGGEMAGFVEGKTDRFKAIVSGAPVIDQYSEYGTEDGSYYDRWYYGRPWEHAADAWRQSPLAYVGNAKTPFLLLQGEADTVDPLGQSQEMYRALRQMGVPVELVQYPRDNHGPLSQAIQGAPVPEKWHGFDARQRIVAFIRSAFTPQKP